MSKEMIKKETEKNELVEQGLFAGASSGFEGTSSETFKTPFLKILQALSPELKKSDPKFIQGAEQGDFCNSATQEIYKELEVIVLKVAHVLVGWKPDRGGFVGRWTKDEESTVVSTKEGVQKWDADGNIVNDTIEFYCMNVKNPSDIFIFSLSTASLKHAKAFATRLRTLTADGKPVNVSWAGVWKISTVEEKNDKGSWFTLGLTPSFVRFITKQERDELILPAKTMLEQAEVDYKAIEAVHESVSEDKESVQY